MEKKKKEVPDIFDNNHHDTMKTASVNNPEKLISISKTP
jgi:hypothetical protein